MNDDTKTAYLFSNPTFYVRHIGSPIDNHPEIFILQIN